MLDFWGLVSPDSRDLFVARLDASAIQLPQTHILTACAAAAGGCGPDPCRI
jgi:hypothetical protein